MFIDMISRIQLYFLNILNRGEKPVGRFQVVCTTGRKYEEMEEGVGSLRFEGLRYLQWSEGCGTR